MFQIQLHKDQKKEELVKIRDEKEKDKRLEKALT
jgi:hypothetical protein